MSELSRIPRVIVAGSRTITDYALFRRLFLEFLKEELNGAMVEIVTGRAKLGPDDMSYHLARWDLNLPYCEKPADWGKYGKSAGFIRNADMVDYAAEYPEDGYLFSLWDGVSKGTAHTNQYSRKKNLTTKIVIVDPEEQWLPTIIPFEDLL